MLQDRSLTLVAMHATHSSDPPSWALEQKPHHTLCQYGKIGNTTFGLDFKYPLSAAQAFGMAMSTLYWA